MNRKRVRIWLVAGIVLVGWPLAFLRIGEMLIQSQSIDYSQRPPAQVFQKVFDRPMPNGISSTQISGRSYLIKHWVWMRLKANDAAIAEMISHAYDSSQCQNFPDQSATNKFNVADKDAVHWQELQMVANPECYEWATESERKPSAWRFGIMIVDRKRHLIFVHGAME